MFAYTESWKENSMPEHKIRQELEAEHRPEAIQARLSALHCHSYLADAVLGGIDGGVTTFAVLAGTVGAPRKRGGGVSKHCGDSAGLRELADGRL